MPASWISTFQEPFSKFLATMSNSLINAVRFRHLSEFLGVASPSEFSRSGASLRWLILISLTQRFSEAILPAMKGIKCDYEVRTIDSLSKWDASNQLPQIYYKVIAIGTPTENLRQALKYHVSQSSISQSH